MKINSLVEKNNSKPYTGQIEGNVEGYLKEGMLHGTWIEYFDNGKVSSIINYRNHLS